MTHNFDPPPSYYEPPEPKTYYCPVCGEETDTYYKDYDGAIVGCDNCIVSVEAWELEQMNSELILGEEEEGEDDGGDAEDAEETTFYSDT